MSIHQMQIRFVGIEDRLLLRINTKDHNEFRLWITRRYCKQLRKVLDQLLDQSSQASLQSSASAPSIAPSSDAAAAAVRHFEQEQALSKADLKAEYQQSPDQKLPLGEQPILLSKLAIKPKDDGSHIVCMHPKDGQGLEIAMNKELLHTFSHIIEEGIKRSDWDLDTPSPSLSFHTSSQLSH